MNIFSIHTIAFSKAPDCLPYWAILVLRVAALPPAELDYMLQFMDHNQDRDMEGVEEQVN